VPPAVLCGCYSVFVTAYMLVSMVAPFFPNRADDWGMSAGQIGFVIACDPLGEILAAFMSSYAINQLGLTQSAVLGMGLNGVSTVIFGVVPLLTEEVSPLLYTFIVTRLLNGLATTITYVSVFTMLCQMQPGKTGQVTGYVTVLSSVGGILGPIFGGAMDQLGKFCVDEWGWQKNWQFAMPFLVCSVFLIGPTTVLWKADAITKEVSAAAAGEEKEEEEEAVSFTEELRRMGSVFNPAVAAGAVAVATSLGMMMAFNPILAPHLEARCAQQNQVAGDHFAFGYTPFETSLAFTVMSITFLPLSLWVGVELDKRGRDFPWMRRFMAAGLCLNFVCFFFLGPSSLLGNNVQRMMESTSALCLSLCILGVSTSMTSVAAFPFIEGICEQPRRGGERSFTTEQRLVIAGTWYQASTTRQNPPPLLLSCCVVFIVVVPHFDQ